MAHRFSTAFLIVCWLCLGIRGDVYLHNPRGSNNRLNEQSAERANANRVFDSQNNNRGGYNVGVIGQNDNGNNENQHYRMAYFQSHVAEGGERAASILRVEWTNQHACGGSEATDPQKVNCNLVLQYMCQDDDPNSATGAAGDDLFRNGGNTNQQNYNRVDNLNENKGTYEGRRSGSVDTNKVLHEDFEWYDKCFVKERNKGLFTADQVLTNNQGLGYSSAIYTRQNPNGNRRGYECPEERDYYPYWHPTPWKDAAVLADNETLCEYYQERSFNVHEYYECVEKWDQNSNERRHYSRWNNEADCEANGGDWRAFSNYLEKATQYTNQPSCEGARRNGIRYIWAVPYDSVDGTTKECLVALNAPDCKQAPWSRTNHLGNTRGGEASNYDWVLPYFPSAKTKRCVFRIRYNISTDDYDPFTTDSSQNEDTNTGVLSPVEQNPYVEIGALQSLRLAINTAQLGRTFQDRSHVFKLMARPINMREQRLFNVNVRGKRGNIVQVYPAVEYDFIPNNLQMTEEDLVHFQWTGSNTHNNGNPGGDGQTGDAGEGKSGSDRSNVVQTNNENENFPVPYENTTLWAAATVVWNYPVRANFNAKDLAVYFASSGYFQCFEENVCGTESVATKQAMNNLLDNTSPSFAGAVLKMRKGKYHYICSRNNNFSNRDQRGTITVQ